MKNNTENVLFLLYQHFMNTLMLYSYDLSTETVWLLLLSCSGGKINTYLQLKDCDLIIVHAWEDVVYLVALQLWTHMTGDDFLLRCKCI